MSRTLSSNAIAALNASETGVVFIVLLTITHPTLTLPIYISSDPTTRRISSDIAGVGDTDLPSPDDTDSGTDVDLDGVSSVVALGQPYYVTVSRGNDYVFVPYNIVLPDDRADQIGIATIEIDNVDRSICQAIRNIGNTPAGVLIEIVTSVTPNVVEGSFAMVLRDVTYDAMTVSGRLGFEEILTEAFPPDQVTPATLPGVFAIAGG